MHFYNILLGTPCIIPLGMAGIIPLGMAGNSDGFEPGGKKRHPHPSPVGTTGVVIPNHPTETNQNTTCRPYGTDFVFDSSITAGLKSVANTFHPDGVKNGLFYSYTAGLKSVANTFHPDGVKNGLFYSYIAGLKSVAKTFRPGGVKTVYFTHTLPD